MADTLRRRTLERRRLHPSNRRAEIHRTDDSHAYLEFRSRLRRLGRLAHLRRSHDRKRNSRLRPRLCSRHLGPSSPAVPFIRKIKPANPKKYDQTARLSTFHRQSSGLIFACQQNFFNRKKNCPCHQTQAVRILLTSYSGNLIVMDVTTRTPLASRP